MPGAVTTQLLGGEVMDSRVEPIAVILLDQCKSQLHSEYLPLCLEISLVLNLYQRSFLL